jgi:hypothetical protein
MPQTVTDTVKAWTAPALLAIVLALSGMIWNAQQGKIESLEAQLTATSSTVQVIAAGQVSSKDDRTQFQDATTKRLDQMADLLAALNDAVVRLSALQEREARQQ